MTETLQAPPFHNKSAGAGLWHRLRFHTLFARRFVVLPGLLRYW